MFEEAVRASDAMRHAPGSLMPALCACSACQTFRMIAAPVLGDCPVCGGELTVLDGETAARTRAERAGETVRDAA